ncbi:MAG: hypothetical protein K0A93_06740 [Desulfuromonadaceae bacterium]|nr:hypothetical protein [Desulfuromonadaceae bacterium]
MASNVFVTRTPFQIFNSIEARDRFHSGENNYLFCVYRKETDRPIMESVIDGGWCNVRFVKLNNLTKHIFNFFIDAEIEKIGTVVNCYIGMPKHVSAHVVNSLMPSIVTFIDDGNEIFKIAKAISSGEYKKFYTVPLFKKILGVKSSLEFCKKTNFFTMYDISEYFSDDRIIRNDYSMFKKRVRSVVHTDDVYFIGSNILGQYLFDKDVFIRYIERVRNYYSGRKFFYALHRYEDKNWMKKIGIKLDFEVVQSHTILENFFLNFGKIPKEMATFRSTALDTLAMLYNTSSLVFPLDLQDLERKEHRDEFLKLYVDYSARQIPMAVY